jgi:hypothetical protein
MFKKSFSFSLFFFLFHVSSTLQSFQLILLGDMTIIAKTFGQMTLSRIIKIKHCNSNTLANVSDKKSVKTVTVFSIMRNFLSKTQHNK